MMFDPFQFCLFALVGVANTLLDFFIFNGLTRKQLGFGRIGANLISTSVGMAFSFTVNALWVFDPRQTSLLSCALTFLVVNAISMYVIQTSILGLTSYLWPEPAQWLAKRTTLSIVSWHLEQDFVAKNICKALATCGSLFFNYFCYKLWVFA